MAAKKKEVTFEEKLQQLETLVQKMESGELSLQQNLDTYESGMQLVRDLEQELTVTRQRLTVLRETADGAAEEPMEAEE